MLAGAEAGVVVAAAATEYAAWLLILLLLPLPLQMVLKVTMTPNAYFWTALERRDRAPDSQHLHIVSPSLHICLSYSVFLMTVSISLYSSFSISLPPLFCLSNICLSIYLTASPACALPSHTPFSVPPIFMHPTALLLPRLKIPAPTSAPKHPIAPLPIGRPPRTVILFLQLLTNF